MGMLLAEACGALVAGVAGLAAYSLIVGRLAERRVPAIGKFIHVADARLHYVAMGSGPPVVLVHGLTGQLREFTYALADRLALDHRVIVVDRPGSGYSTWLRKGERSIAGQAKVLRDFLRVLGLWRPLIAGHSLGGAISLKLAIDYPEAVGALALICPLTQPLDEAPAMFEALVIPSAVRRAVIAQVLAVPVGQWQRQAILQAVFAPDAAPADYGTRGGALLKDRAKVFRTASSEVLAVQAEMAGIAAHYPSVKTPVSILFGRDDAVLDPRLHGAVTANSLPRADFTLVEGGHMIPITHPDRVAEWLRQAGRRFRQESDAAQDRTRNFM